MEQLRKGGCLCGAIKYEISGEPITCYTCHCQDCQTRSGSAFAVRIIVPDDSVRIVEGRPTEWLEDRGDRQLVTQLCSKCGTNLWQGLSHMPGVAFMNAGTLEQTSWLKPFAHFWTQSAQPWVQFDESSEKFATQPDDLSKLLEM